MSDPAYAVAYQGLPGAFSEIAARRWCGATEPLLPCAAIPDALDAVVRRRAGRAVVALENSLAGAVPGARELLDWYGVRLVETCAVRVGQALLGVPGSSADRLTEVRSHAVALAQCRRFLAARPHLTPRVWFDTAGAVRDVMRAGDRRVAAIGSVHAARVYGAVILLPSVQDRDDNVTIFGLVTAS